MSTVAEIEAAIETLPPDERERLRNRLLRLRPKTGADLARIVPTRFHLTSQEAEDLARDIASGRLVQTPPPAWE